MTTTSPVRQVTIVKRLVLPGALAGIAAAASTTAVAVVARAAGVSLEIQAEPIPLPAFSFWCLIGAGIGILLAGLLHLRSRFIVVTTVGTVLSLIPAIAFPDDVATKAVLVATHLIAAAIVITVLGRRLPPLARSSRTQDEQA